MLSNKYASKMWGKGSAAVSDFLGKNAILRRSDGSFSILLPYQYGWLFF